jgi:acetylornithine deacetylase/succinyl-diaminopimelate desuccinylase
MGISERILEIAARLVETPTPTGREEALLPYLRGLLEGCGFSVEEQEISRGGYNLLASRGESPLLLLAHIDTFPAYTHPEPYKFRREGDLLIGRGIVDVKGQMAALISAVKACDLPCQIALVADEERSGTGSEELEVEAEAAVVLEPTKLHPAPVQAGALELAIIVYGKAAHGSVPHRGENAIMKAFKLIKALEDLPFLKTRHPLFEGELLTVGAIRGGFEPLVVPSFCRLELDLRLLPGIMPERALRELRELLGRFDAELILSEADPPIEVSQDEQIFKLLSRAIEEALGEARPPVGMPSWTDAANLVDKGIPAVVFGAGDLAAAHSDFEHVSLEELERLTRVLIRLLELYSL